MSVATNFVRSVARSQKTDFQSQIHHMKAAQGSALTAATLDSIKISPPAAFGHYPANIAKQLQKAKEEEEVLDRQLVVADMHERALVLTKLRIVVEKRIGLEEQLKSKF